MKSAWAWPCSVYQSTAIVVGTAGRPKFGPSRVNSAIGAQPRHKPVMTSQ